MPAGLENHLWCGDCLPLLAGRVPPGSVDLCYIDPPFFSQREYRRTGGEPGEPAAFTDRWKWNTTAAAAFEAGVQTPPSGTLSPSASLLRGLHGAFGPGPLLAYLVHLAPRIEAIWQTLASTGTFYLHCDPSAAHYLKLVCDTVFCPRGGEFRNEIVWSYETGGRGPRDFAWKHDTLLRYTKSQTWTFDAAAVHLPRPATRRNHLKRGVDPDGRAFSSVVSAGKVYKYYEDQGVAPSDVWTDVSHLHQRDPERTGYPTQKPLALLERIVRASSKTGDLVLDAYCGSGTTLVAAQALGRRWTGIDQSPEAIEIARARLATAKPEEGPACGVKPPG